MYIIVPVYLYKTGIPNLIDLIPKQLIPQFGTKVLVKFLILLITFAVYKKITSIIFGKLQFNLKNEWIDYLTFKGWKIEYYKKLALIVTVLNEFYTSFSKLMDYMDEVYKFFIKIFGTAMVVFSYFLLASYINYSIFGLNLWDNRIILNYVNNVNPDLLDLIVSLTFTLIITSLELFLMLVFYIYVLVSLVKCMFPVMKYHGRVMIDTSDVPISFIKDAIENLESFDFSDSFVQKQYNKNKITELISFALNFFVKVNNGKESPDFTNFCHTLWAGHLSTAARNDVLFRTNGLYMKIDEICVRINNMNNPDNKDMILMDLNKYLKMIENRDLNEIEAVPYEIKKSNLTNILIKTAVFLQKII